MKDDDTWLINYLRTHTKLEEDTLVWKVRPGNRVRVGDAVGSTRRGGWYASRNRWRVQIGINGKMKFVGYFDVFSDAVEARQAAEREHDFHINHGRRDEAFDAILDLL